MGHYCFHDRVFKMVAHTLIIAEIGVNHNGDLALAKQLIDVAVSAGADIVKFQTFSAERLVTPNAEKAAYQKKQASHSESQYQMLKKLELSDEMHEELISQCRAKGIEFLSTAFDELSIDYLNDLGIGLIKIPSGEITNLPYLRKIGGLRKRIILSTGMSILADVEAAINVLELAGTSRSMITVLHCNTEYPTPMADVNLRAMQTIAEAFKVCVGYSDHTLGIEVPIAAVALGASVIEKHLTLSRGMEGPDHGASLEPTEFLEMVKAIRNIEIALGDGIKRVTPSEQKNCSVARKTLVASRRIEQGELFSDENIGAKRSGAGISPMRLDEVLGRVAYRSFAKDEVIEL